MIIALNGYSGSGKDLVGKMIQYYTSPCSKQGGKYRTFDQFMNAGGGSELRDFDHHYQSYWEIKKFAGKLKEIGSILTGIPVHKFEDQEFKKTNLGPEWNQIIESMPCGCDWILDSYNKDGECSNCGESIKVTVEPMTVREFLQKLGTDGLRDGLQTNVWVNALFADYVPFHHDHIEGGFEWPNWIITDCRFKNEAEAVKERGGVVVRINRPGVDAVNAHSSETSLDNWNFDLTLNNDGDSEELLVKVATLMETIMVTAE